MSGYRVILADPPWRYSFSRSKSRRIENQYPTMSVDEICALPILEGDAVLYLWATAPKLQEALQVMRAWGFQYKSCMVWVKDKIGMGYWARGKHELVLIGTKGHVSPPEPKLRPESAFTAVRGRHSAKPDYLRDLIERMHPEAVLFEMFARSRHSERWDVWGNEAPEVENAAS